MIYNLSEYFKNKFPAELFYTNGRIKLALQDIIPDRNVLLLGSGGGETPWVQWRSSTVQILCRDADTVRASELADTIFDDIVSRFGLILPTAIVDGAVYPPIQTGAITAIQVPYNLGAIDDGRYLVTFNLMIKYRRI